MDAGTVLGGMSALDWVRLAGAILIWLGPGAALVALLPWEGRRPGAWPALPLVFAFATAVYNILLAALIWVPLALSPAALAVIALGGWGLAVFRWRRLDRAGLRAWLRPEWGDVALMAVLAITLFINLWSIRGTYAGVGSDSFHHTLIADLIAAQGRLPQAYGPDVPLETFSYHFGFHAVIGVWSRLTGLEALALTPLGAQLLRTVLVGAVGSLAWLLTERKAAAVWAALITGLVSIFPALAFNWGRFPQMWALALCAVWIGLWASHLGTIRSRRESLLLGVLAAGIVLTHYRVTLFTVTAVGAFALTELWVQRARWRSWLARELGSAAWSLGLVVIACLPWVAHVWRNRRLGYSLAVEPAAAGAYGLERLGPVALTYPANGLLGLLVLGVLVGCLRWRPARVVALVIWGASALALSQPWALGEWMDTITVTISLFVPVAAAIGAVLVAGASDADRRWRWLSYAAGASLVGAAGWGALTFGNLIRRDEAYLQADDVVAAAWIRDNTPPDSVWMVNTFSFPFSESLIIGSDGGYWLPVTAHRRTVTLPMVFSIERGQSPDLVRQLSGLHQLGPDLTTPEALARLRAAGVTHLYLGQRGGPIDPTALERSPYFERLYSYNTASVFLFRSAP